MRWPKRQLRDGEQRKRAGFLWFPLSVEGETRWLENAAWVEEYDTTFEFWRPRQWLISLKQRIPPSRLLTDDEREAVKANPEATASRSAWETSSRIAQRVMDNGGVYNGRLAAIEIDKALHEGRT